MATTEKNKYDIEKKKWFDREGAIDSYRNDMAMIALDLIKENFGKLWD